MTSAYQMNPTSAPNNLPQATEPVQPTQIGRFVIHEEIGRGSNGVVYAATDPVLAREVAIKAIPRRSDSPDQAAPQSAFLQEAKTAAGLNHPGIVTVFEAGQTENVAFIAMERLHGVDLHHWLNEHRVMSARSAAALIARVADALHFAHQRGLIHRDIKPSNIFLGPDGKPKLLDFGVALAGRPQDAAPATPRLIGTPNYMSPEQARGQPLDPRSDVFSLGAILYELLTGHRAFEGDTLEAVLGQVVKAQPVPVSYWRPDMDPLMSTIMDRVLAKDPRKRYPDAAQLRNDLAGFAGKPSGPASAHPTQPPLTLIASVPTPNTWQRVLLLGAGLIAAIALIGVGVWFGRHNPYAATAPDTTNVVSQPVTTNVVSQPVTPAPLPAPANTDSHVSANTALSSPPKEKPIQVARHSLGANHTSGTTTPTGAERGSTGPSETVPPVSPPKPMTPGTLSLAIVPWGQVVVDGANVGYAPPLNHLTLEPGLHTIEIRNGGAPEYLTQVQIAPGQTVTIQHRF